MVNTDGSGLRAVVDANPGFSFRDGFSADVSPDGSKIVYSSCQFTTDIPEERMRESERNAYNYAIAIVDIDDAKVDRLTENESVEIYPAWSPDGSKIASFRSNQPFLIPPLNVLQMMLRDGSNIMEVRAWDLENVQGVPDDVYDSDFAWFAPRWSPEGRDLAVVVVEYSQEKYDLGEDHGRAVYTIGVDGTELVRISETVSPASWSPDGSRLALARIEGDEIVLVTLARDGSDPVEVAKVTRCGENFENVGDPVGYGKAGLSWSPDGEHIMFQCDVGLHIVNLESGVVSEAPLPELSPAILYQGNGHKATWSPDGSRIAVRALNFPGPEPGGYPVVYTMDPDGENVEVLVRSGLAKAPQESPLGEYKSEMAACSSGIVVPQPEGNPGMVGDCVTLLSTRDILAREVPLNWGPEVPIDQWEGITIGGKPSRVIGLELLWGVGVGWLGKYSWNRMEGDYKISPRTLLPKELADLTKLRTLSLAVNDMEGVIPPELANLEDLRHLYIKWQSFWGCVPDQFSDVWVNATSLQRCGDKGP